jgi:transportin-3
VSVCRLCIDHDTVLEDYVQLLKQFAEHTPDLFFVPAPFALALRITTVALTLVVTDVVWAALEVVRIVLTHPSLAHAPGAPPATAVAIGAAVTTEGFALVSNLLAGVVGGFPEEAAPTVVVAFRSLAELWPQQLFVWLTQGLQALPVSAAPVQAKTQFLAEVNR